MELTDDEVERLCSEAAVALRQGRAAAARRTLETLTASQAGGGSEDAWLLLAASRGTERDRAGEEAALNRLLEIAPQSLRGHVAKGDCRAAAGDEDLACHFYRIALRLAEGGTSSPQEVEDVQRAKRTLAELQSLAHDRREARLKARGLPPETWSPRFRHSLELARGRKKLYLQQPTAFNYAELPHVQFYDPAQFSWAPAIEAAAPAMREELLNFMAGGLDEFRAYIEGHASTAPIETNSHLIGSKDWSVLAMCENGWVAPELIARFPLTWQAVLQAPLFRIPSFGPVAVFSLLKAGAHIAPHTGMFNMRLICHLPLIVPPGCRFRVGNEVREWEEGKLLIFDDTIEHEAWNDGPDDRVVLIFDIWRPELTSREQYELTALYSD